MSLRPKIKSTSSSNSKPPEIHNRFSPLAVTPSPSKALSPYPMRPSSNPTYKGSLLTNLTEYSTLPLGPSPKSTPSPSKIPMSTPWTLRSTYFITSIEEEYENKSYKELFDIYFFSDCFYLSSTPVKIREWYEAVLLFTDSVEIEHTMKMDPNSNKEYVGYSKFIIKNILPMTKWQVRKLTTLIGFPEESNMMPPAFNYFDYINAWRYVLLVRPCSHSWFLQVKAEIPEPVPSWFYTWWKDFGIDPQILPSDKLTRFNEFMKTPTRGLTTLEKEMMFFFKVHFPWILVWEFSKSTTDQEHHMQLNRVIKIKWWKPFDD